MTHLHDEIQSQPDVLRTLIQNQTEAIKHIAQMIREFDPQMVVIAARGTSDNAARYAQYMFGIQMGLPVSLAAPSIHTLYDVPLNMNRALVIGISQSGQSADVRRVVSDANDSNALTLAITNFEDSPLAETAQHHIHLSAGEEKSVAATKTYTTELMAIALLVQHIKQDQAAIELIHQVPDDVQVTLDNSAVLAQWVQRYTYIERIAVIGRGYNYATAFEISLKIKELCYIVGEEYSEADFRHGPIAIISPRFPVIVIASSGKTYPLMADLLDLLKDKQADCIVFSDTDLVNQFEQSVRLPSDVPEWLMPICAVIPGQLFGYYLAQAKGYDVDQPRGLKKVTITH